MFRGLVTDCFEMPGKGLMVMLTEVEGEPTIGAVVDFLGGHRTILDVGRNGLDGQPVSTLDRLTGQHVKPHCTIGLEWRPGTRVPQGIRGAIVEEVKLL